MFTYTYIHIYTYMCRPEGCTCVSLCPACFQVWIGYTDIDQDTPLAMNRCFSGGVACCMSSYVTYHISHMVCIILSLLLIYLILVPLSLLLL